MSSPQEKKTTEQPSHAELHAKSSNMLGTAPIGKLLFSLAVPAITAQVVNMLYNIVDRIYIGHMPGDGSAALTGVGVCMPLILIVSAFAAFVASGGAPRASISMGKGDYDSAEKILGGCVLMQVVISAVLTVVLLVFGRDLLLAFGASENTIDYAADYMSIYAIGTLFVQLTLGLNAFITAQGFAKYGMLTVLIGAAANIVLDPIFIFWFDMGVKGAALATILSQACSAWWVLGFLCSDRASLRLQKCYLKFDRRIVGGMLALGVSPFIMASTESLVGFVLNGSLEKFGDIYVGALAILQSAMQLVSVPLTGFAQGFVPVASYNYGHGDRQRVKDCFRIVLTVMFSFNFVLMLLMICFPTIVASAFTSDPELIATVEHVLPLFLAGMTIFGLQRACQNMFVALGQARISIFIALLRKVILLVPLALVLPRFCGVEGVFMAEAVSDATAAICCTLLFFWQFPKILRKMQNLVQN